jgi:hypothetical protein
VGYVFLGATFLSYSTLQDNTSLLLPISVFFTGPKYKAWYHYGSTFYAVDKKEYQVADILRYIWNDYRQHDRDNSVGVAMLMDAEHISAATIDVVRMSLGMDKMYFPTPYFQFEPFKDNEAIEDWFIETNSKYVIASNSPGPEGLRNYVVLVQLTNYLASEDNTMFDVAEEFELPNKDIVTVYRRKGIAPEEADVGECSSRAGAEDGVESFHLTPNTTYVLFTGHFAIQDKYSADYEPGVLHIVQIENTVHESVLEIHNLPKAGSTMCARKGLNLDLMPEITTPLVEEGHCGAGINCDRVQLTQWSVGDPEVDIYVYTRDSVSKE